MLALSCSFKWPFRRKTAASEALRMRGPKVSGSGVCSSSCQKSRLVLLVLLPPPLPLPDAMPGLLGTAVAGVCAKAPLLVGSPAATNALPVLALAVSCAVARSPLLSAASPALHGEFFTASRPPCAKTCRRAI